MTLLSTLALVLALSLAARLHKIASAKRRAVVRRGVPRRPR